MAIEFLARAARCWNRLSKRKRSQDFERRMLSANNTWPWPSSKTRQFFLLQTLLNMFQF